MARTPHLCSTHCFQGFSGQGLEDNSPRLRGGRGQYHYYGGIPMPRDRDDNDGEPGRGGKRDNNADQHDGSGRAHREPPSEHRVRGHAGREAEGSGTGPALR